MIFSNVKKIIIPEGEVKKIEHGSTLLWKGGYTNLVPESIDSDGSIFNGTGYRDGYRLSSSGGLSSQSGTATTGFIPCGADDVIRMAGISWHPEAGYCYLIFYDAGFGVLGSVNEAEGGSNFYRGIVTDATAITTEKGVITFKPAFSNTSGIAYFRINGYGSGANMIVTVNEEIEL